jgi:hypothetical protein
MNSTVIYSYPSKLALVPKGAEEKYENFIPDA